VYTDQVESGCADPFQLKNEKKKKQNNNVIYMKGERERKKNQPWPPRQQDGGFEGNETNENDNNEYDNDL